jgi:PAS domain S-box-containing protein
LLIGVEPNDTYRLLLANESFYRQTGYTKHDIGKSLREVTGPHNWPKLSNRYKKVTASKQPIEFTEWYDAPIGRQAYHIKLIPILNAVGEVVQLASLTRNVTELKTLREQAAETLQTLETLTQQLRQSSNSAMK